jgi:hypothetical protein
LGIYPIFRQTQIMRCLPPITCRISQPQYEISIDMSLTFNPTGHFATVQGWNNKNCLQTGSSEIRNMFQHTYCIYSKCISYLHEYMVYLLSSIVEFQAPRYPFFVDTRRIWRSCKIIKLPDRSTCLTGPCHQKTVSSLQISRSQRVPTSWYHRHRILLFLGKMATLGNFNAHSLLVQNSKPPFSYNSLLHSDHSLPNWLNHVVPIFDRRSCKGPTTLEHMEHMDMEPWEGQN